MVPFLLADGLYRSLVWIFTTGGFHMHPPHSEAENSLILIQVTNISTWTATTSKIQIEISTQITP
jgi:hypothetical protein